MSQKKKQTPVTQKDMANLYKRKNKESPGGQFFQIWNKGRMLRTMWGRSKAEVEKYLNDTRNRFDKVIPTV